MARVTAKGRSSGRRKRVQTSSFQVLEPLPADNAQPHNRADKSHDPGEVLRVVIAGAPVLPEESPHAPVVLLGRVDAIEDTLVSFEQRVPIHLRDDVGGAVHVVARGLRVQTALARQPVVKPRARDGLKEADHGP